MFEVGQAYVALSRYIDLKDLQVIGFKLDRALVSKSCIEFYRELDEKDGTKTNDKKDDKKDDINEEVGKREEFTEEDVRKLLDGLSVDYFEEFGN